VHLKRVRGNKSPENGVRTFMRNTFTYLENCRISALESSGYEGPLYIPMYPVLKFSLSHPNEEPQYLWDMS
jgi:hypothetical protein